MSKLKIDDETSSVEIHNANRPLFTTIKCNESIQGEFIEEKIRRITENNEPITDGAQTIYTDRKEGVLAETNIRTDRWEIAQAAMDTTSRQSIKKKMEAQTKAESGEGTAENQA